MTELTPEVIQALKNRKAKLENQATERLTGTTATTIPPETISAMKERKKLLEGRGVDDPNLDTKTGLDDIPTRIGLSFAETPDGRERYLNKRGYKTERLADGRLTYTNKKTGKKTLVDEQGLSLKDLADMVGELPELALGTLGGVGGSVAGLPGAATGGALGMATGRAGKYAIGEAIGVDEQVDMGKELGYSALAGALGEAGGAGASKALAPVRKTLAPGYRAGKEKLAQYGAKILPSQATKHRGIDTAEQLLETSLFGGGAITREKLKAKEGIKKWSEELVEQMGKGGSPEELGVMLQDAIKGGKEVFKKQADVLFKKAGQLGSKVTIPTAGIKSALTEIEKGKKILVDGKMRNLLPSLEAPTTKGLFKDIRSLPDEIGWEHAAELHSMLSSITRQSADPIPTQAIGLAKHINKAVFKEMEKVSKEAGGELNKSWRQANEFYKGGKELYNHAFVKAVLNSPSADKIVPMIFKKNNIQNIRRIKNIATPQEWGRLRSGYITSLFSKKDEITGKTLKNAFKELGESTQNLIFEPWQKKKFKTFMDTLEMLEDKPLSTRGGMLIQMKEAGAMMQLAGGGFAAGSGDIGTASTIFLAPAVIARLWKTNAGIKYLTEGIVTSTGSKQAINLSSRILSLLAKEELKANQKPYKPTQTIPSQLR